MHPSTFNDIVQTVVVLVVLYLTRNVGWFLYTQDCGSVAANHGSAVDVKLKVGLTPLHNRVYGDIICNNDDTRRQEQLPSTFCPTGLAGSLDTVIEYINNICANQDQEDPIFDTQTCAICLEDTDCTNSINSAASENVKPLLPIKCGHCFHEECISQWRRMKNNCPLCNKTMTWKKNIDCIRSYSPLVIMQAWRPRL